MGCVRLGIFIFSVFLLLIPNVLAECLPLGISGYNILDSDHDACYFVGTDNTVLDCNGYMIYTSSPTDRWAIEATGLTNVTIKNCFFKNFTNVILFDNTNNSLIENNIIFNTSHINDTSVSSVGINITESSSNNIIRHVNMTNMTTKSTDTSKCSLGVLYAVFLSAGASNNTFENITIKNIEGEYTGDIDEIGGCNPGSIYVGNGLDIKDSLNTTLFKFSVNTTTYYAVYATDSDFLNVSYSYTEDTTGMTILTSDNATIFMNEINNTEGGIFLSGNYPNITGNVIRNTGTLSVARGIELGSSSGFLIDGNYLNYTKGIDVSNDGIIRNNVIHNFAGLESDVIEIWDYTIFDNNTIYNFSDVTTGILSLGKIISSNNVITNGTRGYYLSTGADNSVFTNDTLSGMYVTDFELVSATNISLFNVSYNKTNVTMTSSDIGVYYYMRVNTTNQNYTSIADARVTLRDVFGSAVSTQTTGSDGLTPWFLVKEYTQTADAAYVDGCVGSDAGITCATPHTAVASATDYQTNTSTVTISSQTDFISILTLIVINKIQIILELNNTEAGVYIPATGFGENSSSTLGGMVNYTSPYFYLASWSGDAVTGLVSSSGIRLFTSNTTSSHRLGLEVYETPRKKILLPLTRGTWREIDNRMGLIHAGAFLDSIKPTFGFGLGWLHPIKIILEPASFDLISSLILQKGRQGLTVSYNGTVGTTPTIVIEKI